MTAGRRDQLASALRTMGSWYAWPLDEPDDYYAPSVGEVIDALLPVVDRMIRQAQADELHEAAQWTVSADDRWRLIRRANALRATTDHPDVTQDAP